MEVEISTKCTPLWREAYFSSQECYELTGSGQFLDVQKSFCLAGARESTLRGKWAKRECFQAGFCVAGAREFTPCRKWAKRECFEAGSARTTMTITTTTKRLYTMFHYTARHYTSLLPIPLHYTVLNTLNYTTLHYIFLKATTKEAKQQLTIKSRLSV